MEKRTFNTEYNYYDVLEIPPGAGHREIIEAYQRAKITYSNESPALYTMFSPSEAKELLKMIEEAYSVLSNQELRASYDGFLLQLKSGSLTPISKTEVVSTPTKKNTEISLEKLSHQAQYEKDSDFEAEIESQEEFGGPFLQKVRTYKNISIEQISDVTRISRTYLIAIETNNFSALPAAVFVRGFINQYAKILGLNTKKVADSYMGLYKKGLG